MTQKTTTTVAEKVMIPVRALMNAIMIACKTCSLQYSIIIYHTNVYIYSYLLLFIL